MQHTFYPLLKRQNAGDMGTNARLPRERGGFWSVWQWGQSGDREGTKWGHFSVYEVKHTFSLPKTPRIAAFATLRARLALCVGFAATNGRGIPSCAPWPGGFYAPNPAMHPAGQPWPYLSNFAGSCPGGPIPGRGRFRFLDAGQA